MVLPLDNPSKSYWIEAANSPIRDLQSTPQLPQQSDLIIIGSGYTGASLAYWIHKHTCKHGTTPNMLLLEARDICGGATGRNGGQLRPHAYSRYTSWSNRFGADGAHHLIKHEMAHLAAFQQLLAEEGLAEEVCLKYGETFDAAMTESAWKHLKGEYDAFVRDHGKDGEVIRDCRLIEDPKEAEEFTQMKGCLGAVVHPAGQIWPYKFVHALLRLVTETGKLNVQSHTPALQVSDKDAEGWITVTTPRGETRARAVVHATNAWASHLLPEYKDLIFPSVSTLGALRASSPLLNNTGAQHWGGDIWNYHLQLPAPYHTVILGGAKHVLTHYPSEWLQRDDDTKILPGVAEYVESWPASDTTAAWDESGLALPAKEGGVWTGVTAPTADAFPFVGAVPAREGHFVAAGFGGHGMPRILLSTAHLVPLVLQGLKVEKFEAPALTSKYPSLPRPFVVTAKRLEALQLGSAKEELYAEGLASHKESAMLPFAQEAKAFIE